MSTIIKIKNDTGSNAIWAGKEFTPAEEYTIPDDNNRQKWRNSSELLTAIGNSEALISDGSTYFTDINKAINWLKGNMTTSVAIEGVKIENERLQSMNNRVPNGYSLYITGVSDDLNGSGVFGTGNTLLFDSTDITRDFQLINHYYAIGARAMWESCSLSNFFNATLIAPASSSLINQAGDFNKVEIIPSSGLNIIVPAAVGQGAWDIDLSECFTSTNVLKSTPVPAAGNDGYFDYVSDTNVLTVNTAGEGGYNLYDFDVNLHSFGRKVWGTPQNGGLTELDVSGLVGKLLYNTWKVKLDFGINSGSLSTEKAAVIFITATKKNI